MVFDMIISKYVFGQRLSSCIFERQVAHCNMSINETNNRDWEGWGQRRDLIILASLERKFKEFNDFKSVLEELTGALEFTEKMAKKDEAGLHTMAKQVCLVKAMM